ncbi:lss, partial [Symbiodinium necroappetens]
SIVQPLLKDVKTIVATAKAFAALLGDGRVVTWGVERYGGSSCEVQEPLQGCEADSCHYRCFRRLAWRWWCGDMGSTKSWGSEPRGSEGGAEHHSLFTCLRGHLIGWPCGHLGRT